MSSIVVSGDTSGAVTLSAPAVAGTVTVTLPSTSGVMAVGGGTITTLTTTSDITVQGVTVGRGAGAVATNTAVGASALSGGSLSGARNIGIGQNAGNTLTTGAQNTFVGSYCGTGMVSGTQNIGIGDGAMTGNSAGATGSYNVGIGALTALTTGASNVGVGYQALNANTTASNNTAVGYQAGYAYTGTTGYNTFYGWHAGTAVTTGSVNTYIGPGAGNLMTSGTKNTIIGAYNGNSFGLDIRTASNYIVLSDGDGNPRAYWNGASPTFNGGLTIASTGQVFAGGSSSGTSTQCYMYFAGTDSGAGSVRWYIGQNAFRTDGSYAIENSGGTGLYLVTGNTAWTATSDERLKTDLQPIENAAQKISTLRAVTGRFKTDDENVSRAFLIAQDVQAVLPQAVDASDPEKLGVQYTDVIPLLVAAIKELKAELDTAKAQIAALQGASA